MGKEKQKKKKVTRNKFRDVIGDYYLSNRELSKADKARYEEERQKGEKKDSSRERAMVIAIVVLLILLVVKSCFLDEEKNLTADEEIFKDFVEYTVAEDRGNSPVVTHRITNIFVANPDENALLRYVDPETGEEVEVILEGRYTAQVRRYFLGVIPFGNFSITSQITE
ncbi:MAG: hypothetical protein Q4C22_02075 [Bacillota bacterium]|nr:hypothetical protein [Bacillota bacterium]